MNLKLGVRFARAGLIAALGISLATGLSWGFGVGVGIGGGHGGGGGIGGGDGGGGGHGSGGVGVHGGGNDGGGQSGSGSDNGGSGNVADGGSGDSGGGSPGGGSLDTGSANSGDSAGSTTAGTSPSAEFLRERAMLEMGMGARRPDRGIGDALRWGRTHRDWWSSFLGFKTHDDRQAVDAHAKPNQALESKHPAVAALPTAPAAAVKADPKPKTAQADPAPIDPPASDPVKAASPSVDPPEVKLSKAPPFGASAASSAAQSASQSVTTPAILLAIPAAKPKPIKNKVASNTQGAGASSSRTMAADPLPDPKMMPNSELKTEVVVDSEPVIAGNQPRPLHLKTAIIHSDQSSPAEQRSQVSFGLESLKGLSIVEYVQDVQGVSEEHRNVSLAIIMLLAALSAYGLIRIFSISCPHCGRLLERRSVGCRDCGAQLS